MNKLIFLSVTLATVLTLTACGGGGGKDDVPDNPDPVNPVNPTGKNYTMTQQMSAEASTATVTLTGLTSQVTKASGSAAWITVKRLGYTSGAPRIEVTVEEYTQTDARQQAITFSDGLNTLVLTVVQAGRQAVEETDVTTPHDVVSDQPAASREL